MCPLHPGATSGHNGHARAGAGLGGCGEPVPPAAGQTLRDRRWLRAGDGLLSVQCGGETVGDTGPPAGPTTNPTGTAGGDPHLYNRPVQQIKR